MPTERQADQTVAERLRADKLRRANEPVSALSEIEETRRMLILQSGREPCTARIGDGMLRKVLAETYEGRGREKSHLTQWEWIELGIKAAKDGKMRLFGMSVEYYGG